MLLRYCVSLWKWTRSSLLTAIALLVFAVLGFLFLLSLLFPDNTNVQVIAANLRFETANAVPPTVHMTADGPDSSNDSVVPILHQSWKTRNLPPRFRRWSHSFARCHPDWRQRLWTDADNDNLIAEHFPWFLPTYRALQNPVQRADASRLFYMYKYGGTYCDLDCECLRPFGHLLANVSLAFGAMEGHIIGPEDNRYVEEGQIENSFMYSIPEHPFIMQLIRQVEKKPFGDPEESTGPYLVMREIHNLRRSKDGVPTMFRGKKYLHVFPPSFFNPFSWIKGGVPACKDKGRFTRADEDSCRAVHYSNGSYVLQYHTQVWLAGAMYIGKD